MVWVILTRTSKTLVYIDSWKGKDFGNRLTWRPDHRGRNYTPARCSYALWDFGFAGQITGQALRLTATENTAGTNWFPDTFTLQKAYYCCHRHSSPYRVRWENLRIALDNAHQISNEKMKYMSKKSSPLTSLQWTKQKASEIADFGGLWKNATIFDRIRPVFLDAFSNRQ